MKTEEWENTYDGFDSPYGTTRWVLDAARRVLPAAEISPACQSDGHNWTLIGTPLSRDAVVYGCAECSKRGLVVLKTVGKVVPVAA